MSIIVEREPEVARRSTGQPPPLIHLFRPKWWELWFLPPQRWRVREGEVTLCGLRCKWTSPRGHHLGVKGEECVVCRDLSRRER